MTLTVKGFALPPFEKVLDVFQHHFEKGLEAGASFSVFWQGDCVVNLWGGHADRKGECPWEENTLAPVFSVTKAVSSLVFATLIEDGLLDYQQKVTDIWPEFGMHGKQDTLICHILSHQAGLSGLRDPMPATDWFNHKRICQKLAEMKPFWTPGTASGYHPILWGFLVDELIRRALRKRLSEVLKERFSAPFALDLYIGLPESEHSRCAKLLKPTKMPDLSPLNAETKAAFLEPWSTPRANGFAEWLKAELPAANGCMTAKSLAKLLQIIALGGKIDQEQVLKPQTLQALLAPQCTGQDRVLPYEISWCNGLFINPKAYAFEDNKQLWGHSGWGGAYAFADQKRELSAAYIMNRQSHYLMGDPRAVRLFEVTSKAV